MKRVATIALIVIFFLAPSIESPILQARDSGLGEPQNENGSNYLAEGTGSFDGTGESLPVTLNGQYSGYGTTSFDSSMPGYTTMEIPDGWIGEHLTTTIDDLSMWVDDLLNNPNLDLYHNERWLFTGPDSAYNGINFRVPNGWTLLKSDPTTGSQHPTNGIFELSGGSGSGYDSTMGWEFEANYGATTPLEPTNEVYLSQQVSAPWREIYSVEVRFLYYVRSTSDMDSGVHLFARFGDYVGKVEAFDTGDPVETWIEAKIIVPQSYLQSLIIPDSMLLDIGLGTDISGQPGVGGSHAVYMDEIELRLKVRPFPEQINLKANGASVKGSTPGSISPYVPDGANRDCYSTPSSGLDLNGILDNGILNVGANASAFPDWSTAYSYQVGLQFPLDVPQGSAITSAYLEVEAESGAQYLVDAFDGRMRILVANESTVSAFTSGLPELRDRYNWIDTDIVWTPSLWSAGSRYLSPNIAPLLEKVVSRTDWQSGNYICIMLDYAHSNLDFAWNNVKGSSNYPQADLSRLFVDYLSPEPDDIVYSYENSKTISIDYLDVAGDLHDFPVLIDIWDEDLHTDVQLDGDDIGFMIGHETLDHEVVLFDRTGNGTHAHLIAWVRVPALSSTRNTEIVMLYGNRYLGNQETDEGVWDEDYVGVWHLDEDPVGTNFDSTSFGNDGTGEPPGNEPGYTAGKIDMSAEFYGATLHRVEVPHDNSLALPGSVTVEAWIRTDNTDGTSDAILAKWDVVGERNYWLGKLDDTTLAFFVDNTQQVSTSYSLVNDGEWHHVAGVADATGQMLYLLVDGVIEGSASYTGSTQMGASVLHIGNNPGSVGLDQEWDGLIDEARVSKSARTVDWLLTSFRNQNSPSTFYDLGDESQIAWFDSDWSYRKKATVSAGASEVPEGYSVHLTFNHASLVATGKSMANGNDIRIVYWDGSQWNELDRILDTDSNWNSDSTKVWFKTQSSIPVSSSDSDYYLYFGNPLAGSPPSDSSNVFLFYDGFESGNLGGWNGSYTDNGDTLIVLNTPIIPVHTGTYAVRASVDTVAAAQGMVWWDFSDETNLFARVHFYLPAGFSTSGHVTIMQFVDTSTGWQNQLSVTINSDMTLYMWNAIANDYSGEAYGYMATNTVSKGSWHMLEMQAKISDTDGEARLWLDGNLEIEETGKNLGTEGVDRFCTVFYWADPQTEANTVYADDAFLRPFVSSEPITSLGPELTPTIGFDYKKDIVVDHTKVDTDLADFPLLLDIFDADIKTRAQTDGDDIIFKSGEIVLAHEIELFDPYYNSTHAHLVAWVKTDLSSTIDTILTMNYGNSEAANQENPAGIWDDSYVGVWHMGEVSGGSDSIKDSTSQANHGTDFGIPTFGATGAIGNAIGFDDGPYIQIPDSTSLDSITSEITISVWTRADPYLWETPVLVKGGEDTGAFSLFYYRSSGSNDICYHLDGVSGGVQQTGESVTRNGWMHVALTYDGFSLKVYRDGFLVSTQLIALSPSIITNNEPLYIGYESDYDDYYLGIIDEARLSNSAKSQEWILAEYRNQNNPESFFTVGPEIRSLPLDLAYEKDIIVDHTKVLADLNDFPLLIDIYDASLKTKAQADGDDIIFKIGATSLNHEIEVFDQTFNSTHAHLIAWVRIPFLSSSVDTDITMLYGNPDIGNQENPTGVWRTRYAGVWHLSETSGNALDSSSHETQGTPSGGVTQGTSGYIGRAYEFNGIDGSVNFGDPADGHLDFGTSSFSYSIWVRVDSNTGTWQLPISKGGATATDAGYEIETANDGSAINSWISDGTQARTTTLSPVSFGQWIFVVAVVNRETNRVLIFRDGVETGSGSSLTGFGSLSTTQPLYLSRPSYWLDGVVDEARIALHPLDPNWIYTEYLNQRNPSSFYTVGAESGTGRNEASVGFTTNSDSGVSLSSTMKLNISSTVQSLTNDLIPGISYSIVNGTLPLWTAKVLIAAPTRVEYLGFSINYPTGAWKPIAVTDSLGTQKTEYIDWIKSGQGLTVLSSAENTHGIWKVEFEDRNQIMDLEMGLSGGGYFSTGTFSVGDLIRFRSQAPSSFGSIVSVDLVDPSGAVWYSTEPTYQGTSFSLPFSHRKSIVIDHNKVASNLDNFPILIDLYDTDLVTDTRADGADIAFAIGDLVLDHEIELFDQNFNGTHARLIAWIEVPRLSAIADTTISMYYGNPYTPNRQNPAGVWDSGYVGVWHLGEIGTGLANEYVDSSIYGNHGQGGLGNSGYVPTQTAGAIGFGQNFVDHFIDCGNDTSLDITGNQITLQLWMQYPTTHDNMGPFNHKGWYNGYRFVMPMNSQKMNFHLRGQDYNLATSQDIAPNEWHFIAATYDGEYMRIYVDGDPDPAILAKTDDIISALPEPFRIGHGDHPEGVAWSYPWLGQIDETRVSQVARSSDWIWTEFQNQADPQSFVSIGTEESIGNYTTSDINLDTSAPEGLWSVRARYRNNDVLLGGSVGSLFRNFIVTHATSLSLAAPTDAVTDHIASREAGDEVYLEVELTDTVTSSVVSAATVTVNWTVLGTPTFVSLNSLGNGRYGKALNTSDLGEARRWRIEINSYHQYYTNATQYLDIDLSHRSYLTSQPPNPIPYGEDFAVRVNLRDAFDNSPINGATITSNGTFSAAPVDYGNGTYLVSIDSSGYGIGTQVFRLTANPVDPLVMSCFLDVTFTYRAIETTAVTVGSDPAEVPWGQTVNTTLHWYDIDHGGIGILGGTVTSATSLQFLDLGDGSYAVTVDTTDYALGTHIIQLTISMQNYHSATTSITLNIVPHRTSLGLEINSTTPVGAETYLNVSYIDIDGGSKSIPSGNLSLILVEWNGGSDTFSSYSFWLDTSGWPVGVHEINITLQSVSSPRFYENAILASQVEVRKLNVFLTWEHLDPFPNGDDFEMFLHVNISEPGTLMDGSPINGIAPGQFTAENDTGSPYVITVTFIADGRYRLTIGGGAFSEGDYKIAIFLDFLPAEDYRDTQTQIITFTYRATRSSLSSADYPQVATTYNTNVTVSLHYVDLDRSLNITTGAISAQGATIVWQHVGNGYYDVIIIVLDWNQGTHSVNLTADAVGYEAKTLPFEVIVQIAYAYARPTVTSIDLPLGDTLTFYVDYWDITNDEPIIGATLNHNWTHGVTVVWTGLTYRVDLPSLDNDPLGAYLILFNFSKGQNYQFGYFNVSINLRTHYTEFRLASIVEPTSYTGVVNVSLYYGDIDNDAGILSSDFDVFVRNQTGVISFLSLENDTSLGNGYYILRISASVFGPTGLYSFTVYFNWTGPGPKYFNGTTSASVNIIGEESKLTLLDSPGPTAYLENMSYLYYYSELYSGDGISNYSSQDVHVYIFFAGESVDYSQIDIEEIDPVGNPGQYTIQFNSTLFGKPGVFSMIVYFNWSSGVAPYYPNKTSVVQVRVTARQTLLSVNPPDGTPYGVNATLSFTFDDATDVVLAPIAKGSQMSVILSLADYSLWYNDTTMTFFISFNTNVLGASIGSKSFTISVTWVGIPYYANVTNRVVLITVLYRETVIEHPSPPPTPFGSNVTLTVKYVDVTEGASIPIDGCIVTLEDSLGTIPASYYSVLPLGGGIYEIDFNTTYFAAPGTFDLTVLLTSSIFYIPDGTASRSLQIQYRLTTLTANPIGLIPYNDSLFVILRYRDLLTAANIGNGSQPIGIEILNGSSWEFISQWRSVSQDYLVTIETYNQMLEINTPYILHINMSYPDVAPYYRWSDVYISFQLRYRSSSLQLIDFPMPTAYLDLVNFTILYQDLDSGSGIDNGEIDVYYGITELIEGVEYFVNAAPDGEYGISISSLSLAGLGSYMVQVRANWLLGAPYHRNASISVGISIVERAARADIVMPPNQAHYLDNLTFAFRYIDVSMDQSISISKSILTVFSGGVQLQPDDYGLFEILGDYYVEINSTIIATGLVSSWNLTLVVNWNPLIAPFYTPDQVSVSITTTNRIGLVTLGQPPTVPIADNMSLLATFADEGSGMGISGALAEFDCLNPSGLVENVDYWVYTDTQGEGSYEFVVDTNALGSTGTFTFRLRLLWDPGVAPYYKNTTTLYLTGSVRLVQALLTNDVPIPSIVPLYYNCSVLLTFTDIDHSVQITGAETFANVRYKSTGLAPAIWSFYVISPGIYQLTVNCSDAAASGTDALIVEIDFYPYQVAEVQIPFQIRLRDGEFIVRTQVESWKGENAILVLELVDRDAFNAPLSGAALVLSWPDASVYLDLGNGQYEITLSSTSLNAGAYTLQVTGSLSDYFISDLSVNVEIDPIPAQLIVPSSVPDVYWGENVTLSAFYNDTAHNLPISFATLTYEFGTLAGSLEENTPGNYSFSLDTGRLAWATTYVVIITASYTNYATNFSQVTVNVLKLPAEMMLVGSLQSQDLYRGQPVNVTVFVSDTHNSVPLSGAVILAHWSDNPSVDFIIPAVPGEPGYYSGPVDTGTKDIGTYTLNLVLKKDNFMTAFSIISVKIVQINSALWLDATTQTYSTRAFNWTDVVRLGVYILVPSLNPGDPFSTGLSDCLMAWEVSGTTINGFLENGTLLGGPGYFYYDFDTEDLRASTYTIRISAVPTNRTFSEATNTTTLTVLRLKTSVISPDAATQIWGWSGYVSFTYWDIIRNVGVNDAYAFLDWEGGQDQASYLGNGSYSIFVNTSLVRPGTHPIILNLWKENHESATGVFNLVVLSVPTEIQVYADEVNIQEEDPTELIVPHGDMLDITFLYNDTAYLGGISGATYLEAILIHATMIEDKESLLIVELSDGNYTLGFDSGRWHISDDPYHLIVKIGLENRTTATINVYVTIVLVPTTLTYDGPPINLSYRQTWEIRVRYVDIWPSHGNIGIENGIINATSLNDRYVFIVSNQSDPNGNGWYVITISSNFEQGSSVIRIILSKPNHQSSDVSIAISVEPSSTDLLIQSTILYGVPIFAIIIVGAILWSRTFKQPKMLRKLNNMIKALKRGQIPQIPEGVKGRREIIRDLFNETCAALGIIKQAEAMPTFSVGIDVPEIEELLVQLTILTDMTPKELEDFREEVSKMKLSEQVAFTKEVITQQAIKHAKAQGKLLESFMEDLSAQARAIIEGRPLITEEQLPEKKPSELSEAPDAEDAVDRLSDSELAKLKQRLIRAGLPEHEIGSIMKQVADLPRSLVDELVRTVLGEGGVEP